MPVAAAWRHAPAVTCPWPFSLCRSFPVCGVHVGVRVCMCVRAHPCVCGFCVCTRVCLCVWIHASIQHHEQTPSQPHLTRNVSSSNFRISFHTRGCPPARPTPGCPCAWPTLRQHAAGAPSGGARRMSGAGSGWRRRPARPGWPGSGAGSCWLVWGGAGSAVVWGGGIANDRHYLLHAITIPALRANDFILGG